MEGLFAYSCLWAKGACSKEDYNEYLDMLFLQSSDSEILLELEECSSSCTDTYFYLNRYITYVLEDFDKSKFGKIIFMCLERLYKSEVYSLKQFGEKCYKLWCLLPEDIKYDEPFFILSYADDCLSYGDEEQTIKLYKEAFDWYKNAN